MNSRMAAEKNRLDKLHRLLEPDVVWIFGGQSVKAHAKDCPMIRTATKKNGLVPVVSREEKMSVRERGFRVVACKCLKTQTSKTN